MNQSTHRSFTTVIVADAPTDPDAFLAWSATKPREEGRYELSNGVVTRTMVNVTRAHTRICTNIMAELLRLGDRSRFEFGSADFGVKTGVGVRGPDVFAGEWSNDLKALSTTCPVFIAEVLSPSTAGIDFTTKLREYTAIATLQTYIICSQDEPRVWVWARNADASWPADPAMVDGRDAVIHLAGLGIDLAMAEIFRGIPDAPQHG
jgi:Uma2 family endonuclease